MQVNVPAIRIIKDRLSVGGGGGGGGGTDFFHSTISNPFLAPETPLLFLENIWIFKPKFLLILAKFQHLRHKF